MKPRRALFRVVMGGCSEGETGLSVAAFPGKGNHRPRRTDFPSVRPERAGRMGNPSYKGKDLAGTGTRGGGVKVDCAAGAGVFAQSLITARRPDSLLHHRREAG